MAKPPQPDWRVKGHQIAQSMGVPWNVFNALVHQESGWNPNAVSPAGAKGFTQLMPGTARGLGVDPNDPEQNLRGGAQYLLDQFKRFGRWDLALAAYNAGPGAVTKYGGVPPYEETQNYVKNIMGMAHSAGGGATPNMPVTPSGAPSLGSLGGANGAGNGLRSLQSLMDFAEPTKADQGIRAKLGPTSASVGERTQQADAEPLPIPKQATPIDSISGATVQPHQVPVIPLQGQLNGQVPMAVGGAITQKYPFLHAQSHVDWQHINPRLLKILNDEGKRRGVSIVLESGYRSNDYSQNVGGFSGDPHTRGIAVDAYINGHPIGDVIAPDEWAKHGVRSGNTPGFYKGKPDPEHLDLVGIPIK